MASRGPNPTRRRVLGGVLAAGGTLATSTGLIRAWDQLRSEDLIPGEPVELALRPDRWHTTRDQLSFAAIGDCGSGGRKAVAVAEELARSYRAAPFSSVSLLGDICYYGPISQRFDEVFRRPFAPLIDAGLAFELAIGNHDGDLWFGEGVADVEATLERLGTPSRYYAVTRGPVDFFYLDSGTIASGGPAGDRQLQWLERSLAESSSRWTIVCLHHPLYSAGAHGSATEVSARLEPILVANGVDLVLAGHDHHYERSVPVHGITHIVSGAGCKLTPVGSRWHTAYAESTLQFLRIDVDGGRLQGRAVGVDGRRVDRFELTHR